MPDQAPPVETPVAVSDDSAVKAELAQQMAISLNGGVPPAAASPAAAAPVEVAQPAAVDPFGIFKEKFGYESPEAAVQDIETLRAFRAAPPVAELKFENEQSKVVAELLQAGKLNEVYEVLEQQVKIDRLTTGDVNPEIAADIVKLGMQIKYKDLTPAEINYKFNKQFGLPPKPPKGAVEDDEEYTERVAVWQAQVDDRRMELVIEAKTLRPELVQTKAKLVFPNIAQPQDASYREWQTAVQENDRLSAETTQAYKVLAPKSLESKLNFVDEANKINFDFQFEPDPQSFKQAQDMVLDINTLWSHFIGPDGNPDRIGFLKFVYNGLNHDKIVRDAMNQAKNATIKASLPDNSTGGLVRQLPQTQEPSELDKLMRESLKGYAGF